MVSLHDSRAAQGAKVKEQPLSASTDPLMLVIQYYYAPMSTLPCLPSGYPGRRFHMNVPSFHPLSNPPIDQHNYKAYFHFTDNLPVKNLGCRSTMISTFTTVQHLHYHPWLKDASAMLSKNPTLPPWSYTKKCNLPRSAIPAEAVFVSPNTLPCHRMLAPASTKQQPQDPTRYHTRAQPSTSTRT
jgi:hypothetical protein